MADTPIATQTHNETPCGSLNDDGCLQIFPRFDGPPGSLCLKCQKIAAAATPEQRESVQESYQSCLGCGMCSTKLREPLCGKCKRLEIEENGLPNPKDVGAAERLEKLRRRTGNPSPLHPITNLAGSRVVGPTTQASDLDLIRTVKKGGNGEFTVDLSYRTKGAVNKSFGRHTFVFDMETSLETVLEKAVAHADVDWLKDESHPLSLKTEDCSLRFKNNASFEQEAESLTLKGLYTYYLNRPDKAHVLAPNKMGLARGTYLILECVIDVPQYTTRLNRLKRQIGDPDLDSMVSSTGSSTGNKRKSNDDSVSTADKRAKTGNGTLYSSLRFTNNLGALGYSVPPPVVPATADIVFIKFEGVVSDESAELRRADEEFKGRMEINSLILSMADRGKSKNVFKLFIEGDPQIYVAKRYYNIGQDRAERTVSKSENDVALAKDLFRLVRLCMWRSKFMEVAAVKNFTEISDFDVSSAFLISVTRNSITNDVEPVTYLVEPLRSSSVVRKFSGTFGSTQDIDKLALTMLAFSHFIMELTACNVSMVDIQGSWHAERGSMKRMVLFDPMSHTISQDSGVGDFGVTGIEDSIETHHCNLFCRGLGLASTSVLKATLDRLKVEYEDLEQSSQDGD